MSKVTMHWFMGLLQDDLVKIGCDHFIVVINIMISIYLNDDFYEIIRPEMYLEFYDLFYTRIIHFVLISHLLLSYIQICQLTHYY